MKPPDDPEAIEYDCSLAAAILIVEMIQTSPTATTPELISFITYACLEAVKEARRRLPGAVHAAKPSVN
ncbi:hypothetical protein [Tautonia marina]|uniref:hypothetical protein n=1 Tax=Tautonia marina TaxID=2653855 RepID=UPI0012611C91|nr:hypothetical protein [Tautonia marina]